jgi:hypothetical protein
MPTGNIIIAWNNIYLELVRRIGGAPGPLARIGALMHMAMFEAVNLLSNSNPNYATSISGVQLPSPLPSASEIGATAAHAASRILEVLIPEYVRSQVAMQGGVPNPFDSFQVTPKAEQVATSLPTELNKSHAATNGSLGLQIASGQVLGQRIADAVLKANPIGSGLNSAVTPILDDTQTGEWRETGSGAALTPQWGEVQFALLNDNTKDQYFPTAIPNNLAKSYSDILQSALYADNFKEVKQKGAAQGSTRTRKETEIAFFWANDLNGTSKPPGQLFTITQTVARKEDTLSSLLETARLFALVGTAMFNASIVAWQAKYFWPRSQAPYIRLWRPETAIQLARTDDNPDTISDRDWQPLSAMLNGARFSPNFPAYVSGHSTFGAAWAAAMKVFFGKDEISFMATTEDPHALTDENGVRLTRSFKCFTDAAKEDGESRVFLGVHYRFDAEGGYQIGIKVGDATAKWFEEAKPQVASTSGS